MLKLFSIASAIAAVTLASNVARADRLCDGAVSMAACAVHRAYVASLHETPDTSPEYMKRLDPRYNEAMRTGGGGDGGGSGQ
jgi:hypothetical protein